MTPFAKEAMWCHPEVVDNKSDNLELKRLQRGVEGSESKVREK